MYINRDDKRALRAMFGHRVRFDDAERRLYQTDLWRPPAGIRRLTRSMPDAVVLPEDESDLVEIVSFANEIHAPLVPRGGGTAMDGGSMPVIGGIVVDFSRMEQDFRLDGDGQRVTVSAGMTFQELAVRLAEHGRAPALEPIFPEATTVGGWLATGGPAFGSNQHGPFEDTVESVRLVLPDGRRRVFKGPELDVVAGVCGSTGLIAQVTLRTRELGEPVPFLASFNDLESLDKAFEGVRRAADWWTLMVESPETAALKGEALGERPPARNAFLLMGAITQKEQEAAGFEKAKAAVEAAGGKVVDAKKTAAWWSTRKEVYRAKSFGPSRVGQSMMVPTDQALTAFARVNQAVKAPHWLMTGIVSGEETLLVGYALDDERRPAFETAYGAALAMKKAVGRLGGRPVSLGVLSADAAHAVLSSTRQERVQDFRGAVDRKGLMNPGKVFGTPIRYKPQGAPGPSLQAVLRPGEAILRGLHGSSYVQYQRPADARGPHKAGLSVALGAAGGGWFGAKWSWDVIAADMDAGLRHASASARAFGELGSSPLGWLTWIKAYLCEGSTFSEYPYRMLAGEGIAAEAEVRTRFGLRYSDMLMDLKARLLEEGYRPVREHREIAARIREHHNMHARDNAQRAAWAEGLGLKEKGATLLFVDDTVSFEAPGFAKKVVSALQEAGEELAYLGAEERSSGHVLFSSGQYEQAKALVEHHAKAVKEAGAKTIVTLDPWTHHVLVRIYPRFAEELGVDWDVKVVHAYELLAKHVKGGKLSAPEEAAPVALHHPPVFHLHGIDDETASSALSAIGFRTVPLAHHGADAFDVGASGAVKEVYPEIPVLAGQKVLEDALRSEAEHLVSSDPASGLILRESRDKSQAMEGEGALEVILLSDEPPRAPAQAPAGSKEDGDEAEAGGAGASDGDREEQAPEQAA